MSKAPRNAILDTRTVSPNRAKVAIQHAINRKRPLFLWGPPGIGKSDVVAQIAKAQNRPLIDIRLPLLEPTDLRGIPYLADIKITGSDGKVLLDEQGVEVHGKEFRWSPPSDLPTDAMSRALVFFDEMSAAPPSVQAATYQIILNRRIGTYQLPKEVAIVAAGNRAKDKGVAYNMPTPLANRFTHLTLACDVEDWKEWAVTNRIHKDVVGFISFQPNDLNTFGSGNDGNAFATPRTWSFVSDLLQEQDEDGTLHDAHIPNDVMTDMICGTVGEGPALKFMTYRAQAANLPHAKDVLSGKVTTLKSKQIDVMYALTTALAYELIDSSGRALKAQANGDGKLIDLFHKEVDTFLRFMMDNFEEELTVMGARIVLGVHKLPIKANKLKNWTEFVGRFNELIPNY